MSAPKVNPQEVPSLGGIGMPPATHTAPFGFHITETVPARHANGQLAAALAKAQGEMKAATYNRINPYFKNRYADLASVIDAIRGPLSKHGLSYTQIMEMEPEFRLVTTLHHNSGETISSYYPLPLNAKPQELGSALTYARRYSLSAITGIAADEDDDANEAQKIEQEKLTPEQVELLQVALETRETGSEARLLTYLSKLLGQPIERLEDIPRSQFATANGALIKKAKAKTEEKP